MRIVQEYGRVQSDNYLFVPGDIVAINPGTDNGIPSADKWWLLQANKGHRSNKTGSGCHVFGFWLEEQVPEKSDTSNKQFRLLSAPVKETDESDGDTSEVERLQHEVELSVLRTRRRHITTHGGQTVSSYRDLATSRPRQRNRRVEGHVLRQTAENTNTGIQTPPSTKRQLRVLTPTSLENPMITPRDSRRRRVNTTEAAAKTHGATNKEDKLISDPLQVAETFNNYFCDVADSDGNLLDVDDFMHHPSIKSIGKNVITEQSFKFHSVSTEYISQILEKLNPRKAVGCDNISQRM
ncbi:predicted protein [Nematostella vectensis]|uniref:Uncharacterized protein n=1 Tax=Nematostella vectensis TaxID=45351 RepID=A7STM3_NEMVE|nr:predicted protein [Nematostella vectensis]|eukprot:XP_001625050.1 predicted protein [Nematostella vectensis]